MTKPCSDDDSRPSAAMLEIRRGFIELQSQRGGRRSHFSRQHGLTNAEGLETATNVSTFAHSRSFFNPAGIVTAWLSGAPRRADAGVTQSLTKACDRETHLGISVLARRSSVFVCRSSVRCASASVDLC